MAALALPALQSALEFAVVLQWALERAPECELECELQCAQPFALAGLELEVNGSSQSSNDLLLGFRLRHFGCVEVWWWSSSSSANDQ